MLTYVEVYDDVWNMHGCSCIYCDRFVLYNIFSSRWQFSAKKYSYVESYEHLEVYDGVIIVLLCSCAGCDKLFLIYFLVNFTGWPE